MGGILGMIIPALIPAASDLVRGIVGRITGGAPSPANVAEYVQLAEADTKRILAMAEIDKPAGDISKWVANLRASFRYIAAGVILLAAIAAIFVPGLSAEHVSMVWSGAESAWSFIFGDRMYAYIRRK